MKKSWMSSVGLLGLSALLLGGCASAQTPQAEVASNGCEQLGNVSEKAGDYLSPGRVAAVSPVRETEFRARALQPKRTVGADLYVHAEQGVTAEYVERVLSCHASSGTALHANDPLHPASGEVAVSVRSSKGGFAVRAVGSTAEAGREIWERAESFTKSPGVVVEQIASTSAGSNL